MMRLKGTSINSVLRTPSAVNRNFEMVDESFENFPLRSMALSLVLDDWLG